MKNMNLLYYASAKSEAVKNIDSDNVVVVVLLSEGGLPLVFDATGVADIDKAVEAEIASLSEPFGELKLINKTGNVYYYE